MIVNPRMAIGGGQESGCCIACGGIPGLLPSLSIPSSGADGWHSVIAAAGVGRQAIASSSTITGDTCFALPVTVSQRQWRSVWIEKGGLRE